MPASNFSQFILLAKKNFKVSVLRDKRSSLFSILLPTALAVLMLWARGYIKATEQEKFSFPEFELKTWPAGLDVPVLNNQNKSEFMLFYAPKNAHVDTVIQGAVDEMNNDYAMWYSYEEYLLNRVIYQPVRDTIYDDSIINTSAEEKDTKINTTISNIEIMIKTYIPWYKIRQKEEKELIKTLNCIVDNDYVKDPIKNITICKEDYLNSTKSSQTRLDDLVISNLRASYWSHCQRPMLFNILFNMAKYASCNPVPQSRINDQFFLANLNQQDIDMFKSPIGGSDIASRQSMARIIQNMRAIDLEQFCPSQNSVLTSAKQAASHIHSESPRLKVVQMGFDSVDEMQTFILDEASNKNVLERRLGVIEIENFDEFANGVPENFKYALRLPPTDRNSAGGTANAFRQQREQNFKKPGVFWRTGSLKVPFQLPGPRLGGDRSMLCTGQNPNYHKEGFTMIQNSLDQAFIEEKSSQSFDDYKFVISRMPYGKFFMDIFPFMLQLLMHTLFVLATIYLVLSSIRSIVGEKETRIREYMRIMGASSAMQWAAWTFHFAQVCFLISVIITVMFTSKNLAKSSFKYSHQQDDEKYINNTEKYDTDLENVVPILPFSNPILFLLTIFINLMQVVVFTFLLSIFCKSSSDAASIGGLVHFFIGSLFGIFTFNYVDIGYSEKVISCVFPSLSMGHVWYFLATHEGSASGLTTETLFEPLSVDKDFSMFGLWIIMILYCILYFVLIWYFESIFPGEFGVAQPWNFPFQLSYWFPKKGDVEERLEMNAYKNVQNYQPIDKTKKVAIKIDKLRKEFTTIDGKLIAVNDLSLEICHGEILALLGHNGAGKTTTVNMLTGMMEPTQGTAYINNMDIRTDMTSIRSNVGLCPQFNILFPTLTVGEHLEFFAVMKGVAHENVKTEVTNIIKLMMFENYVNSYPSELSGGWKRRLSVCIALIADSKVIILDEPTSGMDPSTRRVLWNILNKVKSTRTIILSTHFMDEADILGDRVAIMSAGTLEACGSSLFLKNKYGTGYHVLFTSKTEEFSQDQSLMIANTVKKVVPKMAVERCIGQEMNVVLPFEAVKNFPELFKLLDQWKDKLGFLSYGIMMTNLDEVFLKCTETSKKKSNIKIQDYSSNEKKDEFVIQDEKKVFVLLFLQQIKACIVKNFIVCLRQKWSLVIMIVLSLLMVWGIDYGRHSSANLSNPRNQAKLELSSKPWNTLYNYKHTTPFWYADNIEKSLEFETAVKSLNNDYDTAELLSGNNKTDFNQNLIWKFNNITSRDFDKTITTGVGIGKSFSPFEKIPNMKTFYAHFNGQHFHTSNQAINKLSNVIYRYFRILDDNPTTGKITTFNHPLPLNQTEEEKLSSQQSTGSGDSKIYFDSGFIFAMICAIFCRNKVIDRTSKSKHCQLLTGLPPFTYWFSFYIIDVLASLVVIVPFALMFIFFKDPLFGLGYSCFYLMAYGLLYVWGSLPLFYLLCFFFETASTAVVVLLMAPHIAAVFLNIYIMIMRLTSVGDEELDAVNAEHDMYMKFLPSYAYFDIIDNHYANNQTLYLCTKSSEYADMCEESNLTYSANYWAVDDPSGTSVGKQIHLMINQGLCWFLLLIIIEFIFPRLATINHMFSKLINCSSTNQQISESTPNLDQDVHQEQINCQNSDPQSNVLLVKNLSKIYSNGCNRPNNLAVDNLSFCVKPKTCFGLLGVNGAGKTTSFKMFTGDEYITSGNVWTAGHSLISDRAQAQASVGYCPQFDALIDGLTGSELLKFYCDLRGLSERDRNNSINELCDSLDLTPHRNKPCGIYSGGNKRKLSTGLAMVGEPPLLFLDEPSTGMDPGARHALWDSILKIQNRGSSIILTSHSMEECEALCSKLAIMVNGQFKCFGTVQHLRDRFGKGYTIEIAFETTDDFGPKIRQLMLKEFKAFNIIMKEDHGNSITYDIPIDGSEKSIKLPVLFTTLQKIKENNSALTNYSVRQRTLEELFLEFTKCQRHDELQA